MNKRSKIIIAILIFIFLGLIVFAFASPSEEENLDNRVKQGEVDKKPSKKTEDQSVKKDEKEGKEEESTKEESTIAKSETKAVETKTEDKKSEEQKSEDKKSEDKKDEEEQKEQKEEKDTNADVADALIDALEKMIEQAAQRKDIESAIYFNENAEIQEAIDLVKNADTKNALQNRLDACEKLLNATINVNINDGDIFNSVTVEVTDDAEVTITLAKDQEATSVENGVQVTEEGTYTLTITDSVYNEKTVTFIIDTTPATKKVANILISGKNNSDKEFYGKEGSKIQAYVGFDEAIDTESLVFGIKNGENIIVAEEVTEKVNDDGKYIYTAIFTITKEAFVDGEVLLNVTNIKDIAGNPSADIFTPTNGHIVYVDMIKPVITIDSKEVEEEYTSAVTPVVTDDNLLEIKLDGSIWDEKAIESAQEHTLVATDKAGNETTVTFNIKKVIAAPTVSTQYNKKTITTTLTFEVPVKYVSASEPVAQGAIKKAPGQENPGQPGHGKPKEYVEKWVIEKDYNSQKNITGVDITFEDENQNQYVYEDATLRKA